VRDLHPGYLSTALAEERAQEGLPLLALQHHFAHAHAVLAEHRFQGRALVLALDGTGFGEDGTLWGGEALLVDTVTLEHRRLAHFFPLALPGGEAAIREPWRIAHAFLLEAGLDATDSPWLPRFSGTARLIPAMLARKVNTPYSTSCGRLFDAASALLGLCLATSYEGQAAIRLEEAQAHGPESEDAESLYPCPTLPARPPSDCRMLETCAILTGLHKDRRLGTPVAVLARRFHASLAAGLAALTQSLAREHGIRHIGLSGGCLQNMTLLRSLTQGITSAGLIPLPHKEMPPNDGCVSLGQAAWGRMFCRWHQNQE
jgi:hydrogenase maturation protein HypF